MQFVGVSLLFKANRRLALIVRHNRNVNSLQDCVISAFVTPSIFSPATNEAALMIKVQVHGWQAHSSDVWPQLNFILQKKQGRIVVKSTSVVLGVHFQTGDIVIAVLVPFLLCVRVPFAGSNEINRRVPISKAVCS